MGLEGLDHRRITRTSRQDHQRYFLEKCGLFSNACVTISIFNRWDTGYISGIFKESVGQMTTLIIRHFGGLKLSRPGEEFVLPSQFPRSLFIYLSCHPGKVFCRNYLADVLWPDLPSQRSRRALSTALWRLRSMDVVAGYLATPSRDTISFQVPRQTWIDTIAFEHKLKLATACAKLDQQKSLHLALCALELYDSSAFADISDEWAIYERARLENAYCDALYLAGSLGFSLKEFRLAEQLAQRLVGFEPFREDVREIQIRAAYMSGNKRKAQQIYNEFSTFLQDEMGAQPESTFEEICRTNRPQPEGEGRFEPSPILSQIHDLRSALRSFDANLIDLENSQSGQ